MSPGNRYPRSRRRSRGFESSPLNLEQLHQLPSEVLAAGHDTSAFDCGIRELNDWLRLWALNSDAAGNSRTWVWAPDGPTVIAYYAVAPHLVRRRDAPKKVARGSLDEIPGYLLARLALVERLHGRGLGAALLADALTRILHAVDVVGGRVIVVDAIDERAARFYQRSGFVPTPSDPGRLVIKASDVARSSNV